MEGSISTLLPDEKIPSIIDSKKSNSGSSSNPWGNISNQSTIVPSFSDVMSEEMVKNLSVDDKSKQFQDAQSLEFSSDAASFNGKENPDLNNSTDDFILAKMLQAEFDKEYNLVLYNEEKKYNGNCKVSVSFDNFRKLPDASLSSSSSDDEDYLDFDSENICWDSFEKRQKQAPTVGKSGIVKHANGKITTKHDPTICGRRNASKIMQFPPGVETGDGGGFDMMLSNKVYNTLKVHSQAENKRKNRLHDKKEKATAEQSLDPKTRLLIYKLINSDVLKSVSGAVSSGKEACVFHGYGGQIEGKQVPTECALKVYKTTLNEFMTRDKYIVDDFRFRCRFSKQNPRKVVKMWAEKEYHNLVRLREAGIPSPDVVILKKNILVMSFIGSNFKPAPKLKDVQIPVEKWNDVHDQVVDIMKRMYHDCKLIHADLSEYNILWHCNKIWIIDVSQSVEPTHCNAMEFLLRDCTNVCKFFERKGCDNVRTPTQLFCHVTEMKLPRNNTEFVNAIQNYEKNEELLCHGKGQTSEAFDYIFQNMNKVQEIE